MNRTLEDPFDSCLPPERIAGIVLLREDNACLLQLRDEKPGLNDSGYWVFPGGHCENAESLEQGARREFKEETGYRCRDLTFVTEFLARGNATGLSYRITFFACRYDGVQAVHCHEGQAIKFITRDQTDCIPMPAYLPAIWDSAVALLAGAGDKSFTIQSNHSSYDESVNRKTVHRG